MHKHRQHYNSADIYLQLKKLNVLGSVLYIAAHPDDENTRLLTYFANGELYRTGYMSLTRGDGGQNLIGDEQGIDLGFDTNTGIIISKKNMMVLNNFLAALTILVFQKVRMKHCNYGIMIKY